MTINLVKIEFMYLRTLILIITIVFLGLSVHAQDENNTENQENSAEKESVVFEKLYDEPYDIYKLWLKFQPLYFDMFLSNINAGYGFEAQFIEYEKFDLQLSFRKPYSSSTDVYRKAAELNNDFSTTLQSAYFVELGGTYHAYDDVKDGIAKIVLRNEFNSEKARKREALKPVEFVKVAAKVREIVGARAGFMAYSSTVNYSDLAIRQNIESLEGSDGSLITNFVDNRLYGNVSAMGFYIGGSYSQFRNVIIKPENYSNLGNDILVTAYADLIVMPSFNFSNVFFQDVSYDVSKFNTNPIGFRVGLEGKFNQKFTYSYGFEAGIRPSVAKRGTFLLFKVSFPVFATSLKMEKEAFESVGDN